MKDIPFSVSVFFCVRIPRGVLNSANKTSRSSRTWMSRWKLGSMVIGSMGYNLLIHGVYWGYNPLILTFDPNFLGHPSTDWLKGILNQFNETS